MPKLKSALRILVAVLMVARTVQASAGELHALVKDQNGQPVEDAVVLATPLDVRNVPLPKQARNEMDQIDKEYVPHVKVVTANSKETPIYSVLSFPRRREPSQIKHLDPRLRGDDE